MEVLKVRELSKKYGKKLVIDNLNMTIHKGDIYGFIGKNGAGKTTLMRMVLTLAKQTSGSIELFGSDNLLEGCKKVGALIETPSVPGGLTAEEALKRYSILYGADLSKIDEILKAVGLDQTGAKKINQFSLGMKQRLGIAIALLNEPEFMVLDEPLNGLDPVGMKEIRDLILKLNREKGITFLISSHLLEELSKTATIIGIIDNGRIVEERTIDEINNASSSNCQMVYKVDDSARAAAILEEETDIKNGTDAIVKVEAGTITISCAQSKVGYYNKLLVMQDIEVSGIKQATVNLEDYYVEKVGEAK